MDLTKLNFHETDKLMGARNYLIWAFRVERIFRSYKPWDLRVPPQMGNSSFGTTSESLNKATAKEKGILTPKERLEKCLNIYSFTILTSLIPSIKQMGTDPTII